MTGLLVAVYVLIGSLLIHGRLDDIAMDVPNPGDITSSASTVFRWIFTWPMWVRR